MMMGRFNKLRRRKRAFGWPALPRPNPRLVRADRWRRLQPSPNRENPRRVAPSQSMGPNPKQRRRAPERRSKPRASRSAYSLEFAVGFGSRLQFLPRRFLWVRANCLPSLRQPPEQTWPWARGSQLWPDCPVPATDLGLAAYYAIGARSPVMRRSRNGCDEGLWSETDRQPCAFTP